MAQYTTNISEISGGFSFFVVETLHKYVEVASYFEGGVAIWGTPLYTLGTPLLHPCYTLATPLVTLGTPLPVHL